MSNMVIKLKIPNGAPFVCPTCSKSFTTGKGLGGHKRVHMEKKNNKRNHESMELQIGENGEQTLVPNSCPVCHQTYASEKALHGHMRKHPNRGWRGMIPPPPPPPPVGAEAPPPNQANISLVLPQPSKSAVGENSSLVTNGDSDKTNVKEEKEFLCDICGMVFRSYHALGGHRSHHCSEDDRSAATYMEQSEGFVGDANQGQLPVGEEGNGGPSSSPVFGFDLNKLPPEVDD